MLGQSGHHPANECHDTRTPGSSGNQLQDDTFFYEAGQAQDYHDLSSTWDYSAVHPIAPYNQFPTLGSALAHTHPVNFGTVNLTGDPHKCFPNLIALENWETTLSRYPPSDGTLYDDSKHEYSVVSRDHPRVVRGSYQQQGNLGHHILPSPKYTCLNPMAHGTNVMEVDDCVIGLEEPSSETVSTATTAPGFEKRSPDSPMEDENILRSQTPRKTRRPCATWTERQSSRRLDEIKSLPARSAPDNERKEINNRTSAHEMTLESLTAEQQNFVRQWYETLAQSESIPNLSIEDLSALATLTQTLPQVVFDYLKNTYPSISGTTSVTHVPPKNTQNGQAQSRAPASSTPPPLMTANTHLHPKILTLVQKFLQTCRRTRPRTDGRRSVNSGPYRCTFGCNYTTRRVFDWRRHEETHEPQELWLCTLCSRANTTGNIFLVSRKDKFLRHARELHGEWKAEKVLELSRVDFRASKQGWTCARARCGWMGGDWDERCRHVLGHFDDEVMEQRRRANIVRKEVKDENDNGAGRTVSSSVESDDQPEEADRNELNPMDDG